jgi:hypothetical protein
LSLRTWKPEMLDSFNSHVKVKDDPYVPRRHFQDTPRDAYNDVSTSPTSSQVLRDSSRELVHEVNSTHNCTCSVTSLEVLVPWYQLSTKFDHTDLQWSPSTTDWVSNQCSSPPVDSDAARDRTCTGGCAVRSPHYRTYVEKNSKKKIFPLFVPLSPLSSTVLSLGQNYFFSPKKKKLSVKTRKQEKCSLAKVWGRTPDMYRPYQRTTIQQ